MTRINYVIGETNKLKYVIIFKLKTIKRLIISIERNSLFDAWSLKYKTHVSFFFINIQNEKKIIDYV